MAIYAPGRRDRHNRPLRGGARSMIASLSLTAMVDMFTVLAVFLLQNYQTTGEVIDITDNVELPQANAVKELRPAHVVVISKERIMLDKETIATFAAVKEQSEWKIEPLAQRLEAVFKEAADKRAALVNQVRQAVEETRPDSVQKDDPMDDRRITVQADKTIDFLTVKKVMLTLTDAGASEINFAVIKEEKPVTQ
ncbi:MAG: biopolymer transporter ExbD [Bdellovibrionota bacterium]